MGDAAQGDTSVPRLKIRDHDLPHLEGKERNLSLCLEEESIEGRGDGEGRGEERWGGRREVF